MNDLHWFVRYYLSQSYINKANNIYEYVKIKIQTVKMPLMHKYFSEKD